MDLDNLLISLFLTIYPVWHVRCLMLVSASQSRSRRRSELIPVSDLLQFMLPVVLFPLVITFWKHHDAREMAFRRGQSGVPAAEVSWSVSVLTAAGSVRGKTRDISEKGVGFICVQPLSPGDVVRMTIESPDHPIAVGALVLSCNRLRIASQQIPYYAIRVSFQNIRDEEANFLATVVQALPVYNCLPTWTYCQG